MSDDTSTPFENKSDIPPVIIPVNGFTSRIPQYLLEGKSESEQFVLNEVSKMGHFMEWVAPIIVDSNLNARKTNGKVAVLWNYKETFTGWKGALAGLAGLAGFITSVVEIWPYIKSFFIHH